MRPLPGGSPVSDVVMPGDDVYDDLRRIYNSLHDQHPALIVRVAETSDVARALELARVAGHEVAVRGGGHSIAGHGSTEGGLLIDLAGLNHIDIDARDQVARVGAGVTAGRLTAASCRQDLVVPLGDSPDVGVGGITLGGGIGWLSRKLGLTLDSLESAEVVTADGRVVTASEGDHSDLFWAIRGGGGNFGVVTEFRYRLHPIGAIVGGLLALPASTDVLLGIIELAAAAPDELGIISLVTRLPPLGFVPPEAHGRPAVLISLVWCGDQGEGDRQVDRFRALAPPLVDLVQPRRYPEMYAMLAEVPTSITNITSSFLADELDEAAVDVIIRSVSDAAARPDVLTGVEVRVLGGAINRVSETATAFAHRRRNIICSVVAAGFNRSEARPHRLWVTSVTDQLGYLTKGAYVNFLDAADQHRLEEVYPEQTRRRLADVKMRYDPDNLFHRNLNIRPVVDG